MNKAKGKGKGKAQVAEKAKARALARHTQFRERQRELRDYFAYFRRGKEKRWDEERREPVFSRYRVPRPGRWLGIAHDRRGDLAPPDPDLLDQGLLRVYGHQAEVVDEADDIDDLRIQRRAAEFAKLLKPHKIVFNKVLGWGGQGLALLFDILDLKNEKNEDQWTRVVVKCALKIDHDDFIVDESKWHKEWERERENEKESVLCRLHTAKFTREALAVSEAHRVRLADRCVLLPGTQKGEAYRPVSQVQTARVRRTVPNAFHDKAAGLCSRERGSR